MRQQTQPTNHNFINSQESYFDGTTTTNPVNNKTTVITSEESVVIDVVKRAMDGVVSIGVVHEKDVDFDKYDYTDSTMKIGTGFVVRSDGLIVTNQHVVSDPYAKYTIITNDGTKYKVEEIIRDTYNDIALLKIDAKDLKPLKFVEDSSKLQPGQLVIAIGTPLGKFEGSVTTGVISAINRTVQTAPTSFWESPKTYYNVIQTDASINPGNSGGPLLNSSGEVVGVNFATTSIADNISFALPANIVKGKIDEYEKYGEFIRPYLGIRPKIITPYITRYYPDLVPGALVVEVFPNSPASHAGIKQYDIIVEIDGKKVETSVQDIIDIYKPGDKVKVKVYRDGEYKEFDVTLGKR